MHVQAAPRAVENEVLELTFEIGLNLQELQPEHLGVDRDLVGPAACSGRLIDEFVGLDGLLGDCVNGVLQDLSFLTKSCIASRHSCPMSVKRARCARARCNGCAGVSTLNGRATSRTRYARSRAGYLRDIRGLSRRSTSPAQ
jgi:hypothetical protein